MPLLRSGPRRAGRTVARLLPVASAVWTVLAAAQQVPQLTAPGGGTGAGGTVFTPTASLSETLTDNANLSADKHADLTSQGTVGIHASSRGGRVRGFIDYGLTEIVHSSAGYGSQLQNSLDARGTAELVTNRLFVDVTGNISQQSISAFGTQSVDNSSVNANRTQVANYGVSPYARGQITSGITYEARLNGNWSDGGSSAISTAAIYGALLHVASVQAGLFSWTVDGSGQLVDYSVGQKAKSEGVRATLSWNPNPELQLSLIGGREANNYLTTGTASYADEGVSGHWKPSTRTNLSVRYEHRYFGNSHQVDFVHRTGRTAWTASDSRDVSTSQAPTSGVLNVPSLAYQQLFASLAASFPDPVERDLRTRELLATQNISPVTQVLGGFLVSQVVLQRLQSVSVSLTAPRQTFSLRLSKTASSGLNNATIATLSVPTAGGSTVLGSNIVRQTALLADVSHRLTPISSLGVSLSWLRTTGDLPVDASTLRALYLTWSTAINLRASLSGGLRHSLYDGATSSYDENAVYANFSYRF